ncbi:MAG TPA: methyltransferase domain-containing protein [Rhodocyclaceae bacterium]
MTFSTEWDDLYRSGTHLSIWPWSDVVTYVHRYANPSSGFNRVLELGCGAGANIPLFLKLGSDYFAIEGSSAIVQNLCNTYPTLSERIVVGDFTKEIPFDGLFDLVLDRSSLISNTTEAMQHTLRMVFERLRSGGKFIGIDWFSDKHQDATRGEAVDSHTRRNLPADSHLAGTGAIHFCDRDHLIGLLEGAGFQVERLEHKQNQIAIPAGHGQLGWWNFVALRP